MRESEREKKRERETERERERDVYKYETCTLIYSLFFVGLPVLYLEHF